MSEEDYQNSLNELSRRKDIYEDGLLNFVARTSPSISAKAKKLSASSGVDYDVVFRNLDEVDRREKIKKIKRTIEKNPFLGAQMQDPDFAAVAYNDVGALEQIESAGRIRGSEVGLLNIAKGLVDAVPQGLEKMRQGIFMQWAALIGSDRMREKAISDYSAVMLEEKISTPEIKSVTGQAIYGGLSSTIQQAPAIALSVATRMPSITLGYSGLSSQTQAYAKYRERGGGKVESLVGAMLEATTEVLTELMPMGIFVKNIGKEAASKVLAKVFAKDLPGEQIATFVQDAIDTAIANPDKTWGEYFAERPSRAYSTLISSLTQTTVMVGAGALPFISKKYPSEMLKSQAAIDNKADIKKQVEVSLDSETRKIAPKQFKKYLERVFGIEDKVIIDAQYAQELFQDENIIKGIAENDPEVAANIKNDLEEGVDVELTKAEYLTNLSEHHEKIKDYIRSDVDGFTMQEADDWVKNNKEKFEQEAAKILDKSQKISESEQSSRIVFDDIKKKIKDTGKFTESVASVYANVHSAFSVSIGEKLGIKPEDVSKKIDIVFGGREQQALNQVDTTKTAQAFDNKKLYQEKDKKRGGVSFDEFNVDRLKASIDVMKDADLSTVLHEFSHIYFEAYSRFATQSKDIAEDMDVLLKYIGIESLEKWNNMSFEERRDGHEKIADSFEQYLINGETPSFSLKKIFQRVKSWMLMVYSSGRKDGVELTPQVKQVFDNMLATREQIQEKQSYKPYDPMFETPVEAGMTEVAFSDYQDNERQRTRQAEDEHTTRSLRDMAWINRAKASLHKKFRIDAWKKRNEIKKTVQKDVSKEKVYASYDLLKNGVYVSPDGKTAELGKEFKLDYKSLLGMYGKKEILSKPEKVNPKTDNLLTAIAKLGGINEQSAIENGAEKKQWTGGNAKFNVPLFGKKVFVKNGLEFQQMQEKLVALGYNPEKIGDDLAAAKSFGNRQYSKEYDAELAGKKYSFEPDVDWQSLKSGKYGLVTPSNGIHPDEAASMLGYTSGDALVRDLVEMPNKKDRIEAITDQRMLEEYGDISSPEALDRSVDDALHNKAHTKFLHTEMNALDDLIGSPRMLARWANEKAEATISQTKVQDIKPFKFSAADSRAGRKANELFKKGDIQSAAREKRVQVLNHHLYRQANKAEREIEKIIRYFRNLSLAKKYKTIGPEAVQQIHKFLEHYDFKQASQKEIQERKSFVQWVDDQVKAGIEPVADGELLELSKKKHYSQMTMDELRALNDTVKNIAFVGRQRNDPKFAQMLLDVRESIEANAKREAPQYATPNDAISSLSAFSRGLSAEHRKFSSITRQIDGGLDNGFMWNTFSKPMNVSGVNEVDMNHADTLKLADIFAPIAKDIRQGIIPASINAQKMLVPGTKISMTTEQRIMFVMNWGNDGNRQRLLDGGMAGKQSFTQEEANAIIDSMSRKEMDVVQNVWDHIVTKRQAITAQELRITGLEPKWIEPIPFTMKHGTYRGGYFPAKYDAQLSNLSSQLEAKTNVRGAMLGATGKASTRDSYAQARAQQVKDRPMLLSFAAISQHISEVNHRLSFEDFLIQSNRALKGLSGDIIKFYGQDLYKQLENTLANIATGDTPATQQWHRILNRFRIGTTIVGMGWRFTTALVQPSGLAQSWVRVGGQYMRRGVSKYMKNPKKATEGMREKSMAMRSRGMTMLRETHEVFRGVKTNEKVTAVKASYFAMIQFMQTTVDTPTWWGAYEKALQNLNIETAADEKSRKAIDDQAVLLADQAVIDSQSSGLMGDLAQIQRGGPVQKLWTSFYSYFSATYNLNVEVFKRTNYKDPNQLGAMARDLVILNFAPVVFSVALKELLKNECGDDISCLSGKLGSEQLNYMLGMTIPTRELGAGIPAFFGFKTWDYQGPAGLRPFADIIRLQQQSAQGEMDRGFWNSLMKASGAVFHLPTGQISQTLDGIMAIESGQVEGTAAIMALIAGPPRKDSN